MSNENNEEIKKLQDDLADGKSMQSEEQVKQSQMSEEAGSAGTGTFEDYLNRFQPHEQRVILEHKDLAQKAKDLRVFIGSNPIFKTLPSTVQVLRQAQLFHMDQYCGILAEVIRLFSGGEEAPKSKGMDLIGDFGTGNEHVFILKYLAAQYIDATDALGNDSRRNAVVATDMEKTQMMAVKSVFSTKK